MKNILYIILISIISLTIISCSSSDESASTTTDTTAPVIAEVTPVPNQISNSAPEYTFSSTEEGTIIYGAPSFDFPESNPNGDNPYLSSPTHSCGGGRGGVSQYERTRSATVGNNTINLYGNTYQSISVGGFVRNTTLYDGTYSICTIIVIDSERNTSNILTITPFTIGSGVFVAVGSSGTIVRSTDNGTTWDNATSPTANNLNGIAYGNNITQNWHKGNYVAVGSSGNIVRSADSTNCKTNAGVSPQDEGVVTLDHLLIIRLLQQQMISNESPSETIPLWQLVILETS